MLLTNSLIDKIDTQTLVQQLMEKLPEDYRTVLQLRIIQGYSRTDAASCMGRSEDSIRGLQYRAVQSLKNLLDKKFEEVDKK